MLDPGNLDALIGTVQVDATLGAAYLTDDRAKSFAEAEATLTKALLLALTMPLRTSSWASFNCKPNVQPKLSLNSSGRWRLIRIWPTRAHLIGLAKLFDGRGEETERDENGGASAFPS